MTRSPDRIDVILAELRDYWTANPDLRLGQIVSNAAQYNGLDDPFFLEETALDGYLAVMSKRPPLYRFICDDCDLDVLYSSKLEVEAAKTAHHNRTGHIPHTEEVEVDVDE